MQIPQYEIITGIVVAITILLLAGFFIVVLVALINNRKRKFIEDTRSLHDSYAQELLRTQLEIQEQTLKNISQEIHDNIGQVLSLAKLNLGTLDINQPDIVMSKVDDSKNLVAKAIQDLRDLSKSMNADYIVQKGLARSLEYELEMIKKMSTLDTFYEIKGSPYKVGDQKELILFRIVQEALNNILRHAGATLVGLQLDYEPDSLTVIVTDNGAGFNADFAIEQGELPWGLGIRNMKNRAQLIGAELHINSVHGSGTMVHIHLPKTNNS
jgi:signal transduction histidine kinase